MYQIFISGYRLAEVTHGKPYYVYSIEMIHSINGTRHYIEKRYSEFNALHRLLKKENETAFFPPKRVRNSNPKVLEHRRAALEQYLQKMLKLSSTKHQVLNFLGIDSQPLTIKINKKRIQTLTHQPIFHYSYDPYVQPNISSSLPDIVTNGVLLGIYGFRND